MHRRGTNWQDARAFAATEDTVVIFAKSQRRDALKIDDGRKGEPSRFRALLLKLLSRLAQ